MLAHGISPAGRTVQPFAAPTLTTPVVVVLQKMQGPTTAENHQAYRRCAQRFGSDVLVLPTGNPEEPLDATMARVAAQTPIRFVHADHESGQELAARYRAEYSAGGISPIVMSRFRDKTLMHNTLRAQRLTTVTLPDCVDDLKDQAALEAFAQRHDYHVMIKPRSGQGATGLHEVTSRDDLLSVCARIGSEASRYRAEEYITGDGPQFHIDSVVCDGQILLAVPSRYTYDLARLRTAPLPGTVTHLQDHSPLVERVLAANTDVIHTLGLHSGVTHCEVFVRGGRIVFGEIAARMGGGPVRQIVHRLTGIDLCDAALALYLDDHYADTFEQRLRIADGEIGALLLHTPEEGTIRSISAPDVLLGDPVFHAAVWKHPGDPLRPAIHSCDTLGVCLVTGADSEITYRHLQTARRRFAVDVVPA